MSTSRNSRLFALAALAPPLTACGGGGGGDAPGTSTPASASRPDAIERYLGTIVLSCGEADEVVDDDTGAPLYVKETWTSLSKSSANKALFQNTRGLLRHAGLQRQCARHAHPAGADTYIVVDGTATASRP